MTRVRRPDWHKQRESLRRGNVRIGFERHPKEREMKDETENLGEGWARKGKC